MFNTELAADAQGLSSFRAPTRVSAVARDTCFRDSDLSVEKALATLPSHPLIAPNGINVSPYTPPLLLPAPPLPCPARYICPTTLVASPPPLLTTEDADAAYLRTCPTPGQVFDAVRPWGAVRIISVWLEERPADHADHAGSAGTLSWKARVEFWDDMEARRFEVGFGAHGLLLKGWRM